MQAINLAQKLSMFSDHWQPRVIGGFNGHDLMVVKAKGSSPGTPIRTRTTSSWCSRGTW